MGLFTTGVSARIEKPSESEDSSGESDASRSINPTGVPSTCKTRQIDKVRMAKHVRLNTEDGRVNVL